MQHPPIFFLLFFFEILININILNTINTQIRFQNIQFSNSFQDQEFHFMPNSQSPQPAPSTLFNFFSFYLFLLLLLLRGFLLNIIFLGVHLLLALSRLIWMDHSLVIIPKGGLGNSFVIIRETPTSTLENRSVLNLLSIYKSSSLGRVS